MNITELKNRIEEQKKQNVELFKIFQYRLHEEEMQPTIEEWRKGSERLKTMMRELQELESTERKPCHTENISKPFVNGYGEATKRNITCSNFERAKKRTEKTMLSFMGNR